MKFALSSFSILCVFSACATEQPNKQQGNESNSASSENLKDANLGLSGMVDSRCQVTYQLVKKVTGMSSAEIYYEPDSGDLVSRQGLPQADFGDSCLSYCSTEFQALKQKNGADRVILRSCSFVRDPRTAFVKGWVSSYNNGSLTGWACKFGQEQGVNVDVYAGGVAGSGVLLGRVMANRVASTETEKATLAKVCGTRIAAHRFEFVIPEAMLNLHSGKSLYVHAIDSVNIGKNFVIGNSGAIQLSTARIVDPVAFDAFLLWQNGAGLNSGKGVFNYPTSYDVISEAPVAADGVFYTSWFGPGPQPTVGAIVKGQIENAQTMDKNIAYPTYDSTTGWTRGLAADMTGILAYPNSNGRQLEIKFDVLSTQRMKHSEARKYCEAKGQRLPTIRELFDFCTAGTAPTSGNADDLYYNSSRCFNQDIWSASLLPGFRLERSPTFMFQSSRIDVVGRDVEGLRRFFGEFMDEKGASLFVRCVGR